MLVLSRDCDTAVKIGNGIRIKILSIRRQRVKLGVEAPKDVRVWREEVSIDDRESDFIDAIPIRLDTTLDGADLRSGSADLPILIVEDDPAQATLTNKILRGQGYNQVTIVSSGAEALQVLLEGCTRHDKEGFAGRNTQKSSIATTGLPRLVLLDYRLADMFGDEFVRQARRHPQLRAIPMVVISADQQDSAVYSCLEAGANAFVAKQVDFTQFQQDLTKTVDFWLDICRVPQAAEMIPDRNARVTCQI